MTLDNEEAEIVVGQNVPFVTGSFTNTGAAAGSVDPFQTIQREDVGITLRIKPQINEGNAVVMQVEQEVSSISSAASAAADIVTDKRSIKTNILVETGQVIVLGGLIEDRVRESVQKVPFLGDLPLLGYLFRSRSTNQDKVNLMVFLHPTILRDNVSADRYTSSKYNFVKGQQFEQHGDEDLPLMPGSRAPRLPEMQELLELPPPFEETTPTSAPVPLTVPGPATPLPIDTGS